MNAQVVTTEYADGFPVQPWAAAVRTAAGAHASEAGPAAAFVPDAPVRKQRDRGASAVEWVIITGIVIVIVLGVGAAINAAISKKATDTSNNIQNANISNAPTGQ